MFSKIIVAFSTLAVLAAALPTPNGESTTVSQCNAYGYAKCCNTVGSSSDSSITREAGLLGVVVDAVDGNIGLGCVDIIGSTCSAHSVCCTDNKANGLVNIQCVNLVL